MRAEHIIQLGVKELWSLLRDPLMLVLIGIAFTVFVILGARSVSETLNKAPIAIIDEDQSPLSVRISGAFQQPCFLPPTPVNQSEMDARMDAGLDTFALNIPPDFQRDVLAGDAPQIQLNVDATRMNQAFNGSGYIQTMVNQEVQEFVHHYRSVNRSAVDLAVRVRFNPELKKSWFGSIMKLIDQVTMLSIILTGAALIRERERGTIEHLLVMPVTPFEIMVSKLWSMGLVVLLTTALSLIFVVQGIMNVPIQGSILLFLAGTVMQLFATTSIGIFMGTYARSMPQFGLLVILVLLPLQMLSGGVTPRESMPEIIQNLMLLAPNTHYVMLAQAILYRGAGFSIVWPQFLALALIGAAFFLVALSRFRKTIGSMA